MAGWDEVLKELNETMSQADFVRRKYLKKLAEYTGRNVIAYYSGFLNKPNESNTDINDLDMTGFMNSLRGMDCSKGLDLILHTPGGSPAAAEAIINYLRSKFNKDIRVIIPQIAMSAGTMMACSAKTIIMGKQSSLGPVDAQYWAIKLQQYPAAFLKTAIDAIQLSSTLLREWLSTCMFEESDKEIVDSIVAKLNEHDDSKTHGRHFNVEFCKSIGLKIELLEEDDELQDAVLSIHHAYMLTLGGTDAVKIIESNNGKAVVNHAMNIA